MPRWSAEERLAVLREAEEEGNVRAACQRHGISRQTFYNWKRRYEEGGLAALQDRSRTPRNPRPRARSPDKVRRIREFALAHPGLVLQELARRLKIPKSTIHEILVEEGISTRRERWLHLENLIREKDLKPNQEQFRFLISNNPAWKDYVFTGRTPPLTLVWQMGAFPLPGKTIFLLACIHPMTGYLLFCHPISSLTGESQSLIIGKTIIRDIESRFDAVRTALGRTSVIRVREDALRRKLEAESRLPLSEVGEDASFGMLERFQAWVARMGDDDANRIFHNWNNVSKPHYPFYDHAPQEMMNRFL